MYMAWSHPEIERTAERIKAVAHHLRLFIVCMLIDGELSAGDIGRAAGTSQPNVSKHLSILAEQGLLMARKEANQVFYSVSDHRLGDIVGMLQTVYCCGTE
jgi:DNA-binding transcriptional ArsR family regulator